MKKIIATAVALVAAAGFAFADLHVNFYNKLYSEDAVIEHDDAAGETNAYFPGIKERMYADIITDKVDAGVKGTFHFFQNTDSDHFGFFGAEINDWWVEFRPFDFLTFGLHDDIWADGSYFPVWDDNVSGGNIGSSGFTAVLRPVENFRIGATIPGDDAINWLNGKVEDGEHENFHFGLGAIFDADVLQIGLSVQNIPCGDDRQIGGYVNFPDIFGAVKGLNIGAGFTHTWGYEWLSDLIPVLNSAVAKSSLGVITDISLGYENLLNAYVTYDADSFALAAEVAFNLADDTTWSHDLYTAASVTFGLIEKLSLTIEGKLLVDLSSNGADTVIGSKGLLSYQVNERNTLSAGGEFDYFGGAWALAFPVAWKYTLEY